MGVIFVLQFATDQSNVDFLLPILLGTVLAQGFQALGILAVVCQVTWQMIVIIVPLTVVYIMFQVCGFQFLNVGNFGGTRVYTLVSTPARLWSFLKTFNTLQISNLFNMQFILLNIIPSGVLCNYLILFVQFL